MQDGNAALRERIALLVREHTQAKIARETESTPSTVSRYLAGMKIPAEFCSRLVAKLGVNPAWLLTGEGAPYLADLHASSEGVNAANLLELVQAMGAISKAKLGALTGRPDRKLLRELDDAISAYERVRTQVYRKTSVVLTEMLDQFKTAVEKNDPQRAEFLCKACRQAARFCDDPDTLRRLDHYEAGLLSIQRKDASALKLQRAAIMRYLVFDKPDPFALREIHAHCSYLVRVGRMIEGRRTLQAAQILAQDMRDSFDFQMLRLAEGVTGLVLGDLREGAALVFDAANRIGRPDERIYHGDLLNAQWFLGLRDARSVQAEHRDRLRHNEGIDAINASISAGMTFCYWEEDPALIRSAIELYSGHPKVSSPLMPFHKQFGAALCAAMERGPKAAKLVQDYLQSEIHLRRLSAESPIDRIRGRVTACQLLRLAKMTRPALEELRAADELRRKAGPEYQMPVPQHALHFRNALSLGPEKVGASLHAEARAWFKEMFGRGYACFRAFAGEESAAAQHT